MDRNPRNHGEPDAEAIEDDDETCPIRQLLRMPVDAVHDDPLHLTGLDASESTDYSVRSFSAREK